MDIQPARPERSVSIETLKAFARDRLPTDSPLRDLLLTEPDELPSSELLVKTSVWLRLLRQGESDS